MTARIIPIVMDAGALSDAAAKASSEAHDHDADPSSPVPGPAPVFVRVAGNPIDEAEIAREMQFHRAADREAIAFEAKIVDFTADVSTLDQVVAEAIGREGLGPETQRQCGAKGKMLSHESLHQIQAPTLGAGEMLVAPC